MTGNTIRGVLFASFSAVAALANIAVAVPAHAQDVAPTASVAYRDLDLASDAGVARLNRRVTYATRSVCGFADPRDFARMAHVDSCRRDAAIKVAPQVAAVIDRARSGVSYAAAHNVVIVAAR